MAQGQKRILIAGGGIGGLTAAVVLGRRGIRTVVLERSSFTEEAGAGIQLGPNATRILKELDILDTIRPASFRPDAMWLFDGRSGQQLQSLPLGKQAERYYGAPYLTIHRADLHAGLRAAAEKLKSVDFEAGFDVTWAYTQGDTVIARSTAGKKVKGSCVIGADGLWSTMRNLLSPRDRLRFAGATAWRALLDCKDLPSPFDAPVIGLWFGPGAHVVHYPVRAGRSLNLVAITEGGAAGQGWNQPAETAALLERLKPFAGELRSLLKRAKVWQRWSLYRLPPLKTFSAGRVVLIGDAAHPVLPYLAQGAALAIEDAVSLAQSLEASPDDLATAFQLYEKPRRARIARVQDLSRRYGWIYHVRGPVRLARNFVLGRRHEVLRDFDWLYGRSTAGESAARPTQRPKPERANS
jgi:2-polyprenyl-6-methoxyphenol hydroxylase-like FAD-dependent oxidoreductase